MPLYIWKCSKCAATEAVDRKIKDIEVPPEEPKCGHKSEDYTRTISTTHVVRGDTWGRKGELK